MGFISRLLGKHTEEILEKTEAIPVLTPQVIEEVVTELNLPQDEIVQISDGVLDVTNPHNIQKFKHNLEVLINQTLEKGELDKFVLIREDDFLPKDWIWQASSNNTDYKKVALGLSLELKRRYALDKAGVKHTFNGLPIPVSQNVIDDAMKEIDWDTGLIYLPVHFRSTKHFTINTPLAVTGDYNGVRVDRNFIVIDKPDYFLNSGYSYSVAYHDAYLDVTHEGLPVSNDAVVLMEESKYKKLKNNEEIMEQLKGRKLIVFRGDEALATNMVLTEMGVLPSQVGVLYANYDEELKSIIAASIKQLATDRSLLYDKSHAGTGGHFTSVYDDKNRDYDKAINDFVDFMKQKFPKHEKLFSLSAMDNETSINEMINTIGLNELLNAVNEYNTWFISNQREKYRNYREERDAISQDVHNLFVSTVKLINEFYLNGECEYENMEERNRFEDLIQHFFQDGSVREQLEAAKMIIKFINSKKKVEEELPALKM